MTVAMPEGGDEHDDTGLEAETEAPDVDELLAGLESELDQVEADSSSAMPASSDDEASEEVAETAEINVEDLGLDFSDLDEGSLGELESSTGSFALGGADLDLDLGELMSDSDDEDTSETDATGAHMALGSGEPGVNEDFEADIEAPLGSADDDLRAATGSTQALDEEMAVDTDAGSEAELEGESAQSYASDEESAADDMEALLADLDEDRDESDEDFAQTEALPAAAFPEAASPDDAGELPAAEAAEIDIDFDDLAEGFDESAEAESGDTVEQLRDDATVEQLRPDAAGNIESDPAATVSLAPGDLSDDLHEARTMTEVGTKLDLARAYVDMGDPDGARSILEEVLEEGDEGQRQQAQQLLDSLP